MSQTGGVVPSDEADHEPPEGEQFDSDSGKEAAQLAWHAVREKTLREYEIWDTWRCVPPKSERDRPLEEYLPGGSQYD